jgi:ribosome biogenesis GTPase
LSSLDHQLAHIASLVDLGWAPDRDDECRSLSVGARPARVVGQSSDAWHVHDGTAVALARARSTALAPRPVTGDWVLVTGTADCRVEQVLARRTQLARAESGGRSVEQVIAANVDVVAVCAAAPTANPRRIERELTAIWSSGATPLVLVTKADAVDDVADVSHEVAAVSIGVDVVAVSTVTGAGLDDVRSRLAAGRTLALIGPSGVGKSSLVNALIDRNVLATAPTRSDGKGRHTTTTRQLVGIPGGGLVLDTPGMREFAPWVDGDGLSAAFSDIELIAEDCRFADCAHDVEPGCAVRAAAEVDETMAERVASWHRMQREQAWLARRSDARLRAEERRRWTAISKSVRGITRP